MAQTCRASRSASTRAPALQQSCHTALIVQATGDPGLADLDTVLALVGNPRLDGSLRNPVREPDERTRTGRFEPSCPKRLRLGRQGLPAGHKNLEGDITHGHERTPWLLRVILQAAREHLGKGGAGAGLAGRKQEKPAERDQAHHVCAPCSEDGADLIAAFPLNTFRRYFCPVFRAWL